MSPRAGGPPPEPHDFLSRRDFGGAALKPGREFERDPLVAVLGSRGDLPQDDLVAGQALQRVLLTATRAGLVTSLISQPIEVPAVREELRVGLRRFGSPKMLLRTGYGVAGHAEQSPAAGRRAAARRPPPMTAPDHARQALSRNGGYSSVIRMNAYPTTRLCQRMTPSTNTNSPRG